MNDCRYSIIIFWTCNEKHFANSYCLQVYCPAGSETESDDLTVWDGNICTYHVCDRQASSWSGFTIVLYPGLHAPAFVTCSTSAGEGLVKLSHMVRCTWTCGGVAHSQKKRKQVSALPIVNMDCRTTERSKSDSLGDVSWVQKPLYSCTGAVQGVRERSLSVACSHRPFVR